MKKKGLIISTIVMVVVLIAALTTSTYAWFSSTGSVTVDSVTLQTVAAEGLQISVFSDVTGEEYQSGTLSWDVGTSKILGDIKDWGNAISFTDPAATAHATTYLSFTSNASGAWVYDDTESPALYKKWDTLTTEQQTALASKNRYDMAAASESTGTMYVAQAYTTTGDPTPTAYAVAVNLTNYFDVPLKVRATSGNVAQIVYRVKVTPVMGTVNANYYPGMAAAARLYVSSTEYFPFGQAFTTSTGIRQTNASGQAYTAASSWSFDGFLYNGYTDAENITACETNTPLDFRLLIWLEGTDNQCKNATAGSGYTVDIEIGYVTVAAAGTSPATLTSGVISGYTFNLAVGNYHDAASIG